MTKRRRCSRGLPVPSLVEAISRLSESRHVVTNDTAVTAARQKMLADALHLTAEVCVQASHRWAMGSAKQLQSGDPRFVQAVRDATMLMAYMGARSRVHLAAQHRQVPAVFLPYFVWHFPLAQARIEHHIQRGEWREAETRLAEFEEIMSKERERRGASPTDSEAVAQTCAFTNFDRARMAQLRGE